MRLIFAVFMLIFFFNEKVEAYENEISHPVFLTNNTIFNEQLIEKYNFSIESGLGAVFLTSTPSTFAPLFNIRVLYPTRTKENNWIFFVDYSITRQNVSLPTLDENVDEYGHFLFFGSRYYFDFDWPIDPYVTVSLGLFATHINPSINSFLIIPFPIPAGGFGLDYMITSNIGVNAEVMVPLVAVQLKLALKVLF